MSTILRRIGITVLVLGTLGLLAGAYATVWTDGSHLAGNVALTGLLTGLAGFGILLMSLVVES